jgi:carbon monoxide dehydrogenase subunit G
VQLINEFPLPLPVDEAWPVLLDIQRMARCVPGASITSVDGESFTGTVRVKVGPVSFVYGGTATFVEVRADDHVVVLEATGRERSGNGAVRAAVTLQVLPAGGGMSRAQVSTDLDITGKAAQFGRAVIGQVAGSLVDDFAARLAQELSGGTIAPGGVPPREDSGEKPAAVPAAVPPPPPSFDPVKALALPLLRAHLAEILAGAALVMSGAALRRAAHPRRNWARTSCCSR